MAKNNKIEIIISAIDQATKSLKKTSGSISSFAKKNEKTFKSMRNIGAVATASIVAIGKKTLDLAGDLELMDKKANIVLKDFRKEVEATARTVSSRMGMTNLEFVNATTGITDLLVPMKFTRKEAVKMATDMTKLSGALSEWSNGQYDAKEVSEILSKAMLGETEQMKALGIKIDQTSKAFNERIKLLMEDKGLTLEQAKAVDIQRQIFEKSTDAQEAYKKGVGSLVDEKKQLVLQFKNARDSLAKALIPTFKKLIKTITPIIKDISERVQENPKLVVGIGKLGGVVSILATVLGTLGLVLPNIITGIKLLTTALKSNPIILFATALIGLREGIIALSDNFPTLNEKLNTHIKLAEEIQQAYNDGKISIDEYNKGIAEQKQAIKDLQTESKTLWGTIKNDFANTLQQMSDMLTNPIESIKGFVANLVIIGNAMQSRMDNLVNTMMNNFIISGKAIADFFVGLKDSIFSFGGNTIKFIKDFSGNIYSTVSGIFTGLKNSIVSIIEAISDYLSGAKTTISEITSGLGETISNIFTTVFNSIKETAFSAVNYVIERINTVIDAVNSVSSKIGITIPKIQKVGEEARKTLAAQKSTTGSRPIGGDVVAGQSYSVGELGREVFVPNTNGKIIPNNQLNSTPTVNITFSGGVHIKDESDMNTFAEKVRAVMIETYSNLSLGTY